MRCVHVCGVNILLTKFSLAPVSRRHCWTPMVEEDVLYKPLQRDVGLPHIAFSDVFVDGENFP